MYHRTEAVLALFFCLSASIPVRVVYIEMMPLLACFTHSGEQMYEPKEKTCSVFISPSLVHSIFSASTCTQEVFTPKFTQGGEDSSPSYLLYLIYEPKVHILQKIICIVNFSL